MMLMITRYEENLSSVFLTVSDANQYVQLQRLARIFIFYQKQVQILNIPKHEQQRRRSDCAYAQAALHLGCLHVTKSGFLVTSPNYILYFKR